MRISTGKERRKAAGVATGGFRRDGDVADIFRAGRGRAPFAGKESTSVGPCFLRYVSLKRAMVSSLMSWIGYGFGSEAKLAADAFVELLQADGMATGTRRCQFTIIGVWRKNFNTEITEK
jgi:hypothetical protein